MSEIAVQQTVYLITGANKGKYARQQSCLSPTMRGCSTWFQEMFKLYLISFEKL